MRNAELFASRGAAAVLGPDDRPQQLAEALSAFLDHPRAAGRRADGPQELRRGRGGAAHRRAAARAVIPRCPVFENFLFQERLVEQLEARGLAEDPAGQPAVSRPLVLAKLTAALETARGLSCLQTGAWACTCEHCRNHPHARLPPALRGRKTLLPEIEAGAGDLSKRYRTEPRRLLSAPRRQKAAQAVRPRAVGRGETKLKGTAGPWPLCRTIWKPCTRGQPLPSEAELAPILAAHP